MDQTKPESPPMYEKGEKEKLPPAYQPFIKDKPDKPKNNKQKIIICSLIAVVLVLLGVGIYKKFQPKNTSEGNINGGNVNGGNINGAGILPIQPIQPDLTEEPVTQRPRPPPPTRTKCENCPELIKCGLRNTYGSGTSKSTSFNLYDPKNRKRFEDNNLTVFGNKTLPGEFPWHVSLRDENNDNFCGGSIIDRKTILTSASCLTSDKITMMSVNDYKFQVAVGWHDKTGSKETIAAPMKAFGTNNYEIDGSDIDVGIDVKNMNSVWGSKFNYFIIHPKFKLNSVKKSKSAALNQRGVYNEHDIAIIKLDRTPIEYPEQSDHGLWFDDSKVIDSSKTVGTFVRPICLPDVDNVIEPRPLEPWNQKHQRNVDIDYMWIVGWGNSEDSSNPKGKSDWHVKSNELTKAYLGSMTNERCSKRISKNRKEKSDPPFLGKIGNGQVCAGSLPMERRLTETCSGDAGSSLSFEVSKTAIAMAKPENKNLVGKARNDKMMEYLMEYRDYAAQYQLVGITSWGMGCGYDRPAVYTKVASYMDWITKYADKVQAPSGTDD